jgi:hypothetical protein
VPPAQKAYPGDGQKQFGGDGPFRIGAMAMSYAPWAAALMVSVGQRHWPVQSVPNASSTQSELTLQARSKLAAFTLTHAPVEASMEGKHSGGSPGPPVQRMHWWLAQVGNPRAGQGHPSL